MLPENSNLVYLNVSPVEGKPPPYLHWYVLNTETGECLKDENLSNYEFPKHARCGILNSKIFVIGGQYPYNYNGCLILDQPLKKILIFDLSAANQDDKKWNLGKPMHGTRALSVVIPLPQLGKKGRLYVFGCDGDNFSYGAQEQATGPWAEYYDVQREEWIQLLNPPVGFLDESRNNLISGSAVYGHGRHTIILWSQYCFCIFDARQEHWHKTVGFAPLTRGPNPDKTIYNPKVVVYHDDRTLLWFFGTEFLAYDLVENKPCENSVFSFQDNKETTLYGPDFELWKNWSISPFLVLSGKNQLCVIWRDNYEWEHRRFGLGRGSCLIHNIKFEISKSSSGGIVLKPLQGIPSSTRVEGCWMMFAGAQWQNDDEFKFDFDGSGPESSSLGDVLEKLPPAMYNLNYSIYLDYKWDKATKMYPVQDLKEEVSLDTFLKKLGLEKYIEIFEKEEITWRHLKNFDCEDFEDVDIPATSRRKLRLALQDAGFGVIIGRY